MWLSLAVGTAAVGSFFAAADRALVLLPEARLQVLVEGDGTEERGQAESPFLRFAADPQRILGRWLVCRVVAISVASVFLARAADAFGLSLAASLVLAVLGTIVTYGLLAEILIAYACRRVESFGATALALLRPIEWLVMPVAEPLAYVGKLISRNVTEVRAVDARTTRTEVELIVEKGQRTGTLANEPAEMIRNVLEFKDITAREVMVPRPRISAIEITTPIREVLALVTSEGHSRYPVYRESLDNLVGLLYAKDLFAVVRDNKEAKLEELARSPVLFVVESQPILSILREMRAKRLHMAVVADEFGGTSGVVTLEDIIEEIVGDIRDEYDTDAEAPIQELGEGRLLADAALPISDLEHKLGRDLPTTGDVDSIGGLIVQRSGRVPEVGASVTIEGVKLIVRDADERRVVKVEVIPGRSPAPSVP
ncbi:MAG: HlyC/CorC family transporter [Myxococcales bacterium]|nr:HlyC/CorC family transporter [Myxococcales bacterium]